MEDSKELRDFIRESNRIEGLRRVRTSDVAAHTWLLSLPVVTVDDLRLFVEEIGGGPLRENPGMDVRVGSHFPPRGGRTIPIELAGICLAAASRMDPWLVHVEYETLHPFMDGNGRSGRALWAWQVLRQGHYPGHLGMGFLHPAYYAALHHSRRASGANNHDGRTVPHA